jgi:hypothetical protein
MRLGAPRRSQKPFGERGCLPCATNGSSANNDSGVGGVTSTTSASGARGVAADRASTMYAHH